jgi:hypothetical protein
MRSHPFCWNKTLASLGIKRLRRPRVPRNLPGRRPRFEGLEQRRMLTGDGWDEPLITGEVTGETVVLTSSTLASSDSLAEDATHGNRADSTIRSRFGGRPRILHGLHGSRCRWQTIGPGRADRSGQDLGPVAA